MKGLMLLLVVLLVGAGIWLMREPAQLARLTQGVKQSLAPAAAAVTPTTTATRKCKRGNEVLYTNDNCPAGSQEQAVKGGSLSVLPAAPMVASPASAAPEPSMMEKRIDKIIGQ
jgi:hypothetical protein